jgi:hypothetical protein
MGGQRVAQEAFEWNFFSKNHSSQTTIDNEVRFVAKNTRMCEIYLW